MLFQIQIPIFEQLLLDSLTRQVPTVVRLDVQLSSSIQIAEMATDCFEVLPSPAESTLIHDPPESGASVRVIKLDLVFAAGDRVDLAPAWHSSRCPGACPVRARRQ